MGDYINKGVYEAVKFILVDERGRVLVEKRSKDKRVFPGIWALPAGHIDTVDMRAKNYQKKALMRECMEELSLVPKIKRYLGKVSLKVQDRRYRVFYWLCLGFDKDRIPSINTEGARLKWANSAFLETLPLKIDHKGLSWVKAHKFVVCVTGTPGTGKTTFAKKLAQEGNFELLELSKAVKKHKLAAGYDRARKCQIVPEAALARFLKDYVSKSSNSLVIDGHMSHFLPKAHADLVISCHGELPTLKARLEVRGYSEKKVRENLDSEIFQVCKNEALELGHSVLSIDPTTDKDPVAKVFSVLDTP